MKSYFVTATDTEIGKTAITAALALVLRARGIDVGVMKPFACGNQQNQGFKSEDAQLLAKAAQTDDPEDLINPYFFPIPASPYSAANKLNLSIDVNVVLRGFEQLRSSHDVVLVEGIGGILTPILKDYCVADLIKDMNLETIIVTSSKIGTVNHTLLTCQMCNKYGLNIRGIIINNSDGTGYDVKELSDDLMNLSGIEVMCSVPHVSDQKKIADVLANNLLPKLMS